MSTKQVITKQAMEYSYLGDLINIPENWFEFNGIFALNTLYYAEYANRGQEHL